MLKFAGLSHGKEQAGSGLPRGRASCFCRVLSAGRPRRSGVRRFPNAPPLPGIFAPLICRVPPFLFGVPGRGRPSGEHAGRCGSLLNLASRFLPSHPTSSPSSASRRGDSFIKKGGEVASQQDLRWVPAHPAVNVLAVSHEALRGVPHPPRPCLRPHVLLPRPALALSCTLAALPPRLPPSHPSPLLGGQPRGASPDLRITIASPLLSTDVLLSRFHFFPIALVTSQVM